MRAIPYIRVSTEEQAQEGFSLSHQETRLRSFCDSQGWQIGELFVDDGYSAKDLNRPALTALRKVLHRDDVVVVLRLDRLTRSVPDLYSLLAEWNKLGVSFRSATESYDTSTSQGSFMIGLLALLAQWERERLGERVKEVMRNIIRTDKRHLGRAPYGYRMTEGRLVIEPAEADVVKLIYKLYTERWGFLKIATHLNQLGITTGLDNSWNKSSIRNMITNPLYAGEVRWGGSKIHYKGGPDILVDGTHSPIISAELWKFAQIIIERRSDMAPRHTTGTYALTGLLYCGLCGNHIHGITRYKASSKEKIRRNYSYYYCGDRRNKGTCTMSPIPTSQLEETVLNRIALFVDPSLLAQQFANQQVANGQVAIEQELDTLSKELQDVTGRIARWEDAYETGFPAEVVTSKLTPLYEQRQTISARLKELRVQHHSPTVSFAEWSEKFTHLSDTWMYLTTDERKQLMQNLFEKIVLAPDRQITLVLRAPFR